MSVLTFDELTHRLENELHRLHYTEGSIAGYRRAWKHIASFLDNECLSGFSEEAGMRFLDAKYGFSELERTGTLTQSLINQLRIVRMLGDFQQHGSILRRYFKQKILLNGKPFQQWLKRFETHCQERAYSGVTCNHYRKATDRFLAFVESQRVWQVEDIVARHVPDYVKTLLGYRYKSVELQLCGLRCFLRFLILQDVPAQPLLDAVPTVKARKQNRIPSVWTKENVEKLIQAIDRGNPAGKRDYAIILLAARLGIRTLDIKRLKLTDLNWADSRIELRVSKTGALVHLPLLPDIGWAIIEYLKNGRPKVESPYVFLRHLAPLEPFSDEHRLHQIIIKYMRIARIPISPNKKKGMHSLRHTLASRLLAENTPLPIISDILGHASTESTAVYLKVDIQQLRQCALDSAGEME
jgi:site-specific recombinase XerD